ncbi:MAG: nudix hydrolase 3 [Candidatus Taylorbacteria bacterium]|nr:nudix hydrolase 3 [Candidatus Taylorbacteria bacterium]
MGRRSRGEIKQKIVRQTSFQHLGIVVILSDKIMEYIDVLDENGNNTGEVRSRDEVHEKGLWHRSVHVWFVNENNEVLLQLRSKSKEINPGSWDISAAGHAVAGDESIEAAEREIFEEIGVVISGNQLVFLGQIKKTSIHKDGLYINNQFDDIYLVKTNLKLSDFKFNDGEVEKVEYIPLETLKEWVKNGKTDLVPHPDEYELLFKSI